MRSQTIFPPEVQFKIEMFHSVYCSWQVVICSSGAIIVGLNVSWNFQSFSLEALF